MNMETQRMKIGVSRPSNTPAESYEVLQTARALGFAGVQLKSAQYNGFVNSPEGFKDRYGPLSDLAQGGLIVYPGNDPHSWPERLHPILSFAALVGAPHICLCSGVYATGASEAQVRGVAEVLMKIGVRAQEAGLIISIHNHVNSLVESEADIVRLLDQLDPDLCGLTLDTAHAAKAGIPSVAALAVRFRKHLLNVHLKDLAADGRFCALGQGTLDLPPILRALEEIDYRQWLIVDEETIELSTSEALQIACDYLRQAGLSKFSS